MIKQRKISVLIPVYNTAHLLKRLLDSLVAQTYQNFEIILVNDGSTDHPENVVALYKEFFAERLHYYSQENKGLAATRNICLQHASGEYVSFIDSDDYVVPEYYETMIQNIGTADIIICGISIIQKDGSIIHDLATKEKVMKTGMESAADSLMQLHGASVLWNKLYKKELFNSFHFIEDRTYEDMYGCAILPLKAKQVIYIEDEMYCYCLRNDSILACISDKDALDFTYMLSQVVQYYMYNNLLTGFETAIRLFIAEGFVYLTKLYARGSINEDTFKERTADLLSLRKEVKSKFA